MVNRRDLERVRMKEIGRELSSLIRMTRLNRRCKAYVIAEHIGMSRFNFHKCEKGERSIHAYRLMKLVSFFGEDGETVWAQLYRDIKSKGLLDKKYDGDDS